LGYHHILNKEVRKEISPHSHILQVGIPLGSEINEVYSSIGMLGSLTIIDVIPELLEKCKDNHLDKRINFIHANATKPIKGEYDIIICYMLLHELPPYTRAAILDNMLKALKPSGKIIFIDYHLPSSYHPLKYIIRAVNRLYQPFAETLWKKSIKDMTPNAENCTWSQQTYFGGVYQKVVATKSK
jgi:ubiquinone/menaquinone biosynthesis C-methylase UbiE